MTPDEWRYITWAHPPGKAEADTVHMRQQDEDLAWSGCLSARIPPAEAPRLPAPRSPSRHPEGTTSKLKTEDREDLSKSKFALPEERKYPVEDKAHARNAKARAAQQEKAGNLSAADRKRIDTKADKVLGKG
ncbi:DUF6582 domain-containing protein [Methylorubrum podarium]|jgi:hypothetical protein|uniref:DUF6582 domain-containing protein n=1 Tax=Methylorubrum podarium TaxID=200476 RepID=UPI001EE18983|nr:DUF6582 domain-containing protein [Methylorubrum podarium]GJE71726.1 hypothetical protein CHKEEEPN_3273 [Methylorubrum podarium]